MRSGSSLRTRLTLAILVLTACVAAFAAQVGMKVLRDNVRDGAIEARRSSPEDFGSDSIGIIEAEVGVEGSGTVTDIGSEVVLPEIEEFETEYVLSIIDEYDLAPELTARFADELGTVTLRLSTGDSVMIDGQGSVVDQPPSEAETVVDASSIASLGGNIFDVNRTDSSNRQLVYGSSAGDDAGPTVGFVIDVTDEYRALDDAAAALWIGVAALTILAAVGSWLLVGRALTPVASITQRVGEITTGNLSDRVPVPRRQDEIGTLATTMNTMLGRLEANEVQRRRFISDASHELRTPVAVLQSEAEAAQQAPERTDVLELSDLMLGESRRMGSLVEDLLSIVRIEEIGRSVDDRGRALSNVGEADVDEVVLAESARSRGVRVDRSAVSAGRVAGHVEDVERSVRHLLDNAARHATSQVTVGVKTEPDAVICWIDDDGPGIALDMRERVFDRFVRLDESRSRDRGGAGLGLAVVSETVEAMGGTVEIHDSPLGGARFQIRWPRP